MGWNKPAFLIGNGINRHAECGSSWADLLQSISFGGSAKVDMSSLKDGITETELYELLKIYNNTGKSIPEIIIEKVCRKSESSSEKELRIKEFLGLIKEKGIPILTTNIDSNIECWSGIKVNSKLRPKIIEGVPSSMSTFSYPWSRYFSDSLGQDPFDSFSVWHINGIWCYKRSLRFGLSEYMNLTRRANVFLSRNKETTGYNIYEYQWRLGDWLGSKTWLRFFFDRPLFIIGLSLETNETFLRWLLIQRKKFFNECLRYCTIESCNVPPIIYVYPNKEGIPAGKKFFFEHLGVQLYPVSTYDYLYSIDCLTSLLEIVSS